MLLKTERLTIRRIVADDWKSIKDIGVDFKCFQCCGMSATPAQFI